MRTTNAKPLLPFELIHKLPDIINQNDVGALNILLNSNANPDLYHVIIRRLIEAGNKNLLLVALENVRTKININNLFNGITHLHAANNLTDRKWREQCVYILQYFGARDFSENLRGSYAINFGRELTIGMLPNELLARIVRELDYKSSIQLMLTSKRFFTVVPEYLTRMSEEKYLTLIQQKFMKEIACNDEIKRHYTKEIDQAKKTQRKSDAEFTSTNSLPDNIIQIIEGNPEQSEQILTYLYEKQKIMPKSILRKIYYDESTSRNLPTKNYVKACVCLFFSMLVLPMGLLFAAIKISSATGIDNPVMDFFAMIAIFSFSMAIFIYALRSMHLAQRDEVTLGALETTSPILNFIEHNADNTEIDEPISDDDADDESAPFLSSGSHSIRIFGGPIDRNEQTDSIKNHVSQL